MRRLRLLAAATVALALAACGSTVQSASRRASDAGLGNTATASQSEARSSVDASTAATPAIAGTQGVTAGGSARRNGRTAGASVSPVTANGPGVTDSTITIGVSYYQSAKAANEAIGAKGVDTGDPVAATKLLFKTVNDRGGIAGRKVQLLFFAVDPQSSTPYASEAQAECTYFTQDNKVFAVIDGAPAADARACLEKAGVSYLSGNLTRDFLYPHEYDPYTAGTARLYAALVPALVQHGWFAGWNRATGAPATTPVKVGIVTADDPHESAIIDNVLIKALREAGHAPDPADVIRITEPGGFTDDGAAVAQVDSAALKLNADGVDHVILDDANGSLALLFTNYAYSQHYFPRYGGTSGNAWQVLLTAGDIQAATLHGAMGIGWQPLFDVPYHGGDGVMSNDARHRCLALFASNGAPADTAATAGGQAETCDIAFFLPAAFDGYRGPVNSAVLLERVNALGNSYPIASGVGSRFAADQHDGTAAYVFMQFDEACGCVGYVGTPRPFA